MTSSFCHEIMYRICEDELCEKEIKGKLQDHKSGEDEDEEIKLEHSIEIMNYKR